MNALVKKRRTLTGKITNFENILAQNAVAPLTPTQVKTYMKQVSDVVLQLNQLHDEISEKCTDVDFPPHEAEYFQLSTRLVTVESALQDLVQILQPQPPPISQNLVGQPTLGQVKLPRLDLPSFTGDYKGWTSFHDLFAASVHNNQTLSGAQKLQYLKTAVKGEAARLIQTISITDANYNEAWDILKARYSNSKQIVFSHLKALCEQPVLQVESASGFRKILDTTVENNRALEVLRPQADHWDSMLVYLTTSKFDSESRRQWEQSNLTTVVPLFKDVQAFMESRLRVLEAVTPIKATKFKYSDGQGSSKTRDKLTKSFHSSSDENKKSCPICKEDHRIYQCKKFSDSDYNQKSTLVNKLRLCYNCLGSGHSIKDCKSSGCKTCSKRHNTLLHNEKTPKSGNQPVEQSTEASVNTLHSSGKTHTIQVLLSTALVNLKDCRGQYQLVRALLDSGSQSSFISEACVQKLGIRRKKANIPINGLAMTKAGNANGRVNCKVSSNSATNFTLDLDALIIPKVTGLLPSYPLDPSLWTHLAHIKLADPEYHTPAKVDLLIGADVFASLLLGNSISGPKGSPTALETVFGWILSGTVESNSNQPHRINSSLGLVSLHSSVSLDNQLKRFWELEEVSSAQPMSLEEKQCELDFSTSHYVKESGHFGVRLPFRIDTPPLGSSRETAIRRWKQVERRLQKNVDHKMEYLKFMEEYLTLGHMELIPHNELNYSATLKHGLPYYIPHHFVLKDSSTTTKFRVVFDASCETSTKVSLNNKLMVGPKIQQDLWMILLRFRTHKIAFTADITKMYRQIEVHPHHQNYQRIVWRKSSDLPIQDYKLLTVTQGTASAPYQAVKTLQQLASNNKNEFPAATKVIMRDFYMDDIMSGSSDIQLALQLQSQIRQILINGRFPLRKWSSNHSAILDSVPTEDRETQSPLQINLDESVATLGLYWHPASDHFSFSVNLSRDRALLTKRGLLSDVARIFDPLGWLAPVVITAKILFQELWRLGLSWDEPLPETVTEKWLVFRMGLPSLEQIRISRWLFTSGTQGNYQLHGFCDASESAYVGVVYLRSVNQNGKVNINLITSKTKVAPIQQISLPRLELCGATLLSRLMDKVSKALKLEYTNIFAWTDSTVVLSWLTGLPTRWKTFVANRTSEIQDLIPPKCWNHVKSEDNPADCASRGIKPAELESHPLWWHGPPWLADELNTFSSSPQRFDDVALEEERAVTSHAAEVAPQQFDLLSRYSSLMKLKRITAYCRRVIHNSKRSISRQTGPLTPLELQFALYTWIKVVQANEFKEEIVNCKTGKELNKKSSLLALKPFVDQDEILRVGGRLSKSNLNSDRKFPIILPRKGTLTDLIVDHEHIRNLHAGPQRLLNTLQSRYWIPSGRDVVRKHVHKCITCFRQRPKTAQQQMGDLPPARTTIGRPFLNTGMDYAGPITLRLAPGRCKLFRKGYIAVFVCMGSKAVHLELVSDLTSEAFIASLKRFISRRGKCSDIFSDNGSNFVGACKELIELHKFAMKQFTDSNVVQFLANDGIKWHLNPPSAPHQGGIWEAAVKSMKQHLCRIMGASIFTFEELSTVLTQIEACLNSRPLCPLSSDINDVAALTPGHFLIGEPLNSIPEPDLTLLPINRLSRWQLTQQITQHFWKRWSNEYISTMQQRSKWKSPSSNITIGDLVIVKDDNLPPTKWNLGRIIETYPGNDNIVRVVSVKTQNGIYKRPIVKVCPLPPP